MAQPSEPNISQLLANALRDAQDLLKKQIDLFRTEFGDSIQKLTFALAFLILAAILVIAGLMVLLVALVKGFALVLGSEVLAALIVGGVLMLIAIVLVLIGHNKMKLQGLAPDRTIRELKQDAEVVEEHFRP